MKKVKPFDMYAKPKKPYWFLLPIEWIGSLFFLLRGRGGKISRHNCETLKPPYILLSNHASMIDMAMAVKAVFPRRAYWLISIEEFVGREWLIRGIGGIYKRKFTADATVVRHILRVLKQRKGILIVYPEARFSLAGVNERMGSTLGDLVKTAKCPVAVMIQNGNFICEPQWYKKNRLSPVRADLTQIVTAEEAQSLPAEEIQKRIEEAFVYDDYRWQADNKIRIRYGKRANNIHQILYQCPVCKTEFSTESGGTSVWCNACRARWEMNEYGQLHAVNGEETFTHVPDWYRWERSQVREEVRSGRYHFEDTVRLEHLENCRIGFRDIGSVRLTHDENGFTLSGKLRNGEDFYLNRPVSSMESCHIEYDFHKKGISKRGNALELATMNETYFVFPENASNILTKLHFATEELFDAEAEKKAAETAGEEI